MAMGFGKFKYKCKGFEQESKKRAGSRERPSPAESGLGNNFSEVHLGAAALRDFFL